MANIRKNSAAGRENIRTLSMNSAWDTECSTARINRPHDFITMGNGYDKADQKQSPGRIIAFGFAAVILIGSGLLMLPCSIQEGVTVRYIDALYTSTSAVCVTGLIAVDAGDTFTPLGQFFLMALIQIGGLGVTAVGAGVILAMGKR